MGNDTPADRCDMKRLSQKLIPKWNPSLNAPHRLRGRLCGRTAIDIVDAAEAIKNDEWIKKHNKREERIEAKHKAAVTLAKMPWDE